MVWPQAARRPWRPPSWSLRAEVRLDSSSQRPRKNGMQKAFEQWVTTSPFVLWLYEPTIGSPSMPRAMDVPAKFSVGSSVVVVADEQATSEQWATFRPKLW